EAVAEVELRGLQHLARQGLARGGDARARLEVLDELPSRGAYLFAPVAPGLGDRDQHLLERGQAVPRLGREVRPAEERLAARLQEDGHRPTALAGQRDDRVHVDRVEVRPLLAVDLYADEALVHHARGERVLEGLALHHVAPVAGGVADREQDRLFFPSRAAARAALPPLAAHPG